MSLPIVSAHNSLPPRVNSKNMVQAFLDNKKIVDALDEIWARDTAAIQTYLKNLENAKALSGKAAGPPRRRDNSLDIWF